MGAKVSWAISIALMMATCWAAPDAAAQGLPNVPPSHVVLVVMENHASRQIIGSPEAPYINALAAGGAYFERSFAIAHPSEPNYLALFSGSTHGVDSDACPLNLTGRNLAQASFEAGRTFVGYSEGLPSPGFQGCTASGGYARKHAPWVNFAELPASTNQPFAAFPAGHLDQLPTIAFVIPNLKNDMHDGSIADGDAWLRTNIEPYVRWARTHNALLILTWDEDDYNGNNQIPTIFHGPMVKAGVYTARVNHYNVLRTIEDLFSLPHSGMAATAAAIDNAWVLQLKN